MKKHKSPHCTTWMFTTVFCTMHWKNCPQIGRAQSYVQCPMVPLKTWKKQRKWVKLKAIIDRYNVFTYVYIYIHLYKCTYTLIYIYAYMYHLSVYVCIYIYIHIFIAIYTYRLYTIWCLQALHGASHGLEVFGDLRSGEAIHHRLGGNTT